MVNNEMTVIEVTDTLNKLLNECKTNREKSLLLNLTDEIANSYIRWADSMQQGYGKTDGDELDNLVNVMRSFSIYAFELDKHTDGSVVTLYNAFEALHKNCMHNYYAKRKI